MDKKQLIACIKATENNYSYLKNLYKGYALEAKPPPDSKGKAIVFLKFANPTTKTKLKLAFLRIRKVLKNTQKV